MTDEKLLELALDARKNAYVPYSGYAVGAALLAEDGRVFTGCNVENAAYGNTLCACLLYTSPSPRDGLLSRLQSSA